MYKPTRLIPYLFSASVLAGAAFLGSCSKDDDAESIRPDVEIPTEFSDLTPEQNKANLETNGLQMVSNINQLKDEPGIDASVSFNHFLSEAELPENGRMATSNKAVKMMLLLSNFGKGKANAADVLKGFRAKQEEEPETPQELFDDLKGTYAYDAETNTWEYTEGGDEIVFKFPSTEAGTTNDAEFAIYGLTTKQVVNEAAEYEGDVPTALKADLTVGSTKHIEYNFTASYKNNGEPTAANTSLRVGAFVFAASVTNTTSEVAVEYSLTKGTTNLIAMGAGASGNFNSDNIGDSESGGDVVSSASAYIQVMNIRLAGEADIKSLIDATEFVETVEEEAAAFNEHTEFVVFYADSKEKIADAEFYGTEEVEEYESCWDENGNGIFDAGECQVWTETSEIVGVRMVFADGSKSDLETYFEIGFEELQAEIEALEAELEEDLG